MAKIWDKAFKEATSNQVNKTGASTTSAQSATDSKASTVNANGAKVNAPVGSIVGGGLAAAAQPTGTSAAKQTYTYTTNANNQPYVNQLNTLYDQIMNRKPFQYDLNGDLLYRQMADRYAQMGQMAMRDTMGDAAALTGGYGNSYAQQVGNQTYQQYMTALNDNIPDLYNQALQAYLTEGDQLLQQYQLAAAHPEYLDAMSPKTYTVTQNAAATPAAAGSAATGAVAGAETAYMNQLAKWLYKDQAK